MKSMEIYFKVIQPQNEYNFILKFLKLGTFVWLFSVVIYNYLLIALTWDFFASFQFALSNNFINLYFESKLKEYFIFYVTFYYLTVFYCQIFTIFCFFFYLL